MFFIQNERRDVDDLLKKICLKIEVISPEFFVVSGKGPMASLVIEEISTALRKNFERDYSVGRHFNEKDDMISMRKI